MADANLKAVISAEDRASKVIAGVGAALNNVKTKVENLKPAFEKMSVVGGIGTGILTGLGARALSSARDFEQSSASFTTMLGSAEKSLTLMKDLAAFGASTPFELTELIPATTSLLAFGVAQEKVLPTLKAVGDISAGVRIPIGELAEIYGKAKVQGRLFGEDINQLTGRGIPVIQQFAKQFGVTESKVKELVTEGKIGFPQLEKAFQDMTGAGGQFFGMMDNQSKTFGGIMSTMSDNIEQVWLAIGMQLLPYAKEFVNTVNNSILPAVMGWVKENPKLIFGIGVAAAAVSGLLLWMGLLGLAIPAIITGFQNVGLAVKGISSAITFLAANPLVMIIAAVALVVAGLVLLYQKSDEFRSIVNQVGSYLSDQLTPIFQNIWGIIKNQLYPALQELWNTFKSQLYPAIQDLWIALQPLVPYFEFWAKIIGAVLVVALLLSVQVLEKLIIVITNVLTWLTKLVTWIIQAGAKGIKSFTDEVGELANAFAKVVDWIEKAIKKVGEFISKAGSIGKSVGGAIGSVFNFRAGGGSVNPNQSYIVGERGAEIFTPSTYGSITPNNRLGAGGGITVNVYGDVSGQDLIEKVKRGIMSEIKQNALV